MTRLTTNPNESGESEQPGEDDDAYMEIDLEGKADSRINAKVIDRASRLVYNEQTVRTCILCKGLELIHDHQDIDSRTLEDADVIFTLADVRAFATEKFRSMRRTNLQQTRSGPRQKHEKQNTKNKRRGRQRVVSTDYMRRFCKDSHGWV